MFGWFLKREMKTPIAHGALSSLESGIFAVNGTPRPGAYVAAQIHLVWVEDASKNLIKSFFDGKIRFFPPNMRGRFASKIYLYCEAAVLRVLLTERERNKDYAGLVREFEKLIFPSAPTSKAMTKLEAVKSAMADLNRVIEKTELSWARSWFAGIGHDETNPATLAMFTQLLALDTKSLRELIHGIGPPAPA